MHTFKNKKRDITTDPTNINFFENFCHKTWKLDEMGKLIWKKKKT
jgi:hypothetical protein